MHQIRIIIPCPRVERRLVQQHLQRLHRNRLHHAREHHQPRDIKRAHEAAEQRDVDALDAHMVHQLGRIQEDIADVVERDDDDADADVPVQVAHNDEPDGRHVMHDHFVKIGVSRVDEQGEHKSTQIEPTCLRIVNALVHAHLRRERGQ